MEENVDSFCRWEDLGALCAEQGLGTPDSGLFTNGERSVGGWLHKRVFLPTGSLLESTAQLQASISLFFLPCLSPAFNITSMLPSPGVLGSGSMDLSFFNLIVGSSESRAPWEVCSLGSVHNWGVRGVLALVRVMGSGCSHGPT